MVRIVPSALAAWIALACSAPPAAVTPAPAPLVAASAKRSVEPEPEPAPRDPALEPAPLGSADVTPPAPEPEPEPERHPFHEPLPERFADAPAMRIANLAPASCRAELAKKKLPFTRAGETRGIANALRVSGKLGSVRFIAPGKQSKFGLLDCRLALTLEHFADLLAEHGVVAVRVDNFYRPQAKLRKHVKSQHAHGLAMDVTSFELADGRSLVVERDWHGSIGAPACGPEARPDAPSEETIALRNLVCAMVKRGLFHHVLTPNYNAAHRDHLHLDIKRDGWKIGVR